MLEKDAKVQLLHAPHCNMAASFWFPLVTLMLLQHVPANQTLLTCATLLIPLVQTCTILLHQHAGKLLNAASALSKNGFFDNRQVVPQRS